jgi:hypothetical protein
MSNQSFLNQVSPAENHIDFAFGHVLGYPRFAGDVCKVETPNKPTYGLKGRLVGASLSRGLHLSSEQSGLNATKVRLKNPKLRMYRRLSQEILK